MEIFFTIFHVLSPIQTLLSTDPLQPQLLEPSVDWLVVIDLCGRPAYKKLERQRRDVSQWYDRKECIALNDILFRHIISGQGNKEELHTTLLIRCPRWFLCNLSLNPNFEREREGGSFHCRL